MSDSISNDEKTENYVSHDPEYDDALGVPDSLNENENISSSEDIDNRGKFMSLVCYFCVVLIFFKNNISIMLM